MREPMVPQLDAEEYLHWEARQIEKFELHHGFVVAFAGGTLDHDAIAFNLRTILKRGFPSPCRTFGSDVKVQIDEVTFFYADAGVVCDPVDGDAVAIKTPRLVCEVLSTRTRSYDLIEKRAAYRSLVSLQAYLIVDSRMRNVEIDTRSGPGGIWITSVVADGTIPLGIGAITLDEVYALTSIA